MNKWNDWCNYYNIWLLQKEEKIGECEFLETGEIESCDNCEYKEEKG